MTRDYSPNKLWHATVRCYRCGEEEVMVIPMASPLFDNDFRCRCGGHRTLIRARAIDPPSPAELPMPKKPESLLQRRIQRRLHEEFPRAYIRKIHGNEFQHGGIPDLICCIDGLFFAIEVKRPDGSLTALQANEAAEIRRAGGIWLIGESPEQVIDFIRRSFHVLDEPTR